MEQLRMSLRLKQEVMDTEACTRCGLCVGLCPYIKTMNERIAFIHDCSREDGNCYQVCPRTPTDWATLDQAVFGEARTDQVLGNYAQILYARSLDRGTGESGQYGGVVSALAAFMVESGESEAAVVTRGEESGPPTPVVARTREEILAASGSKYSASPTLSALNEGVRQGLNNLTVIGRPCQVLGLRKMQSLTGVSEHNLSARQVNFTIGLFCFWSLDTKVYSLFEQKTEGKAVRKIDIPQNFVVLTTDAGEVQIPVDEVREYIRPTCLRCFDPTAEFADVAVGSTEHDPQWNTLIVRTAKGKEVVERAVSEGRLEIKDYPAARLPLLLTAVNNKKQRVVDGMARGEAGYEYLILNSASFAAAGRED
ncbi:MAG: Coenzyme F420 hydrogenase/dehydrogenase, beta subunit C-terminal domain [Desulfitobacteriaceae bacterium]|nr:Coenzyme F420 hydrogenase/dehydrogenase, beta subunit C-terminal domain [Desulfitobacteriaceae bacterium]MDI6914468.1 Coenzyme F420 hydrogenase/dehydrogenase, beta subunit C-terminal domain [Desulfitobacteriaceae bacterium]